MWTRKLKLLPIEVWVLAILPSFFLTYIFLTSKIGFHYFFGSVDSGYLDYFLIFVPPHTLSAIIILSVYAAGRTLFWVGKNIGQYFIYPPENRASWWRAKYDVVKGNVKHLVLYLSVISVGSLVMICKLLYLGTFDADRIAATSLKLMQFDYSLFGVYLPFWLQGHTWSQTLDSVSLEAYMLLSTVLTTIILGLIALKGRRQFRAFILAFFMASAIATPIWMMFPAVTPNELIRENVLSIDTTTPLATYALAQSSQIGTKTTTLLTEVDTLQSRPEIKHWHVPTFPSMHVAWGLIFVYFGFVIAWPLGVVLTAWWLLNITGAVLTLQHYGVDVLLGTIVGAIAIAFAYFLLRFEKRYLSVPQSTYTFLDTIYHDLKRLNDFLIARAKVFEKK